MLRKDTELARQFRVPVQGVKGPLALATIPNFDPVWGFTVNYMNYVLLGVARQLTETPMASSNSNKAFYIETLLNQLVGQVLGLYEEASMTFNVNQLTHLCSTVRHMGPLWANSAFRSEDGNGRLPRQ
ncbi:hypothetical protein HPB47_003425, partial [Ixodes persulcatus]